MAQRPSTRSTTTLTPTETDLANSLLRKILPPSPLLPRLYEDCGPVWACNSNESKILASSYIRNISHMNRIPLSTRPNVRSCTRIKVNGVRCGSPALRGAQFCYLHQRMLRCALWSE
jgi:hypothetical protein